MFLHLFQNRKWICFFAFSSENLGNLKAEPTCKNADGLQLNYMFSFSGSPRILKKACLYMQPWCFQGKQISYLLQRRAKWDRTSKITSLKSLKGKMPDWGTQATAIIHENFQALPLKLWDYPKVFIEQHTLRCFESGLQHKNSNSCCPPRTRQHDS